MIRGLYHGNIFQGDKVAFTAHVSATFKDFIFDNLWLGLFISQVMEKHCRNVQELVKISMNLTRNTFLCEQDIWNIVGKLTKETYKNMIMMLRVFACGFERTQMFCFIIRRVGLKLVESYQGVISRSQSKFRLIGMQHDVIIWSSSAVAIDATFRTNERK